MTPEEEEDEHNMVPRGFPPKKERKWAKGEEGFARSSQQEGETVTDASDGDGKMPSCLLGKKSSSLFPFRRGGVFFPGGEGRTEKKLWFWMLGTCCTERVSKILLSSVSRRKVGGAA